MENTQKGFIVPLVVAIVALVISGSTYFYFKNTQFSQMDSTQAPVSSQNIPAEQATNQAKPVISLISPVSTTPQTLVTITGSGFVGNNDIKFTSISQPAIVAYACGARAQNNNTSILFGSGPSSQDPLVSDCKGGTGVKGIVLQPGLYNVSVINNNGVSNSVSYTIASPVAQVDETAGWQTHVNKEIGFSFKYPQGWKIEPDSLTVNTCCLDLFSSSADPYSENDRLKWDVMEAQFQYHEYEPMLSEQDFINRLIEVNEDSIARGEPSGTISRDTIVTFKTNDGLRVIKFETGVNNGLGYAVPQKQDFSKVLLIFVWHPDPIFEKVLSTFKFTPLAKQ